jgi:hypothetical protein
MAFLVMLNSSNALRDICIQAVETRLRALVAAAVELPDHTPVAGYRLGVPSFHSLREPSWIGALPAVLWGIVYLTQLAAVVGVIIVVGLVTSPWWAVPPLMAVAVVGSALVRRIVLGRSYAFKLLLASRNEGPKTILMTTAPEPQDAQ